MRPLFSSYGHEVVYRATKGQEAVVKNRENPAEIILISDAIKLKDAEDAIK
jgi:YesN/AraC family two-component response regulator